MSATKPLGLPVSDEELMRYLDGELGQERRGEVEAQERGCLAPDLNLERRVVQVTEHEDDSEGCE